MIKISTVLFPTDFSKPSLTAAREALEFCKMLEAKLTILHVVELDAFVSLYGRSISGLEDTRYHIEDEAKKQMDTFIEKLKVKKTAVSGEIQFGNASEVICNYAAEKPVELIVMATHGRTGVSRLLLGSVTERVVRTAPRPVLTLRVPEEE